MSVISEEVERLNLDAAEAFFAVTLHRQNGRIVPTATVMASNLTAEQRRCILHAILDAARETVELLADTGAGERHG